MKKMNEKKAIIDGTARITTQINEHRGSNVAQESGNKKEKKSLTNGERFDLQEGTASIENVEKKMKGFKGVMTFRQGRANQAVEF